MDFRAAENEMKFHISLESNKSRLLDYCCSVNVLKSLC